MKDPKPPAKPHAGAQPVDEAYSEEEAERRRDAALKRMLEMPPKPRKGYSQTGGEENSKPTKPKQR